MFEIQFFEFNGENNVVDKRPFLGDEDDYRPLFIMQGEFKSQMEFINPVVTVTETPENYVGTDEHTPYIFANRVNYAYIKELKKWYFVVKKTVVASSGQNHTWTVEMNLDVLYTFKDDVYETAGLIDRSGSTGGTSDFVPDNMRSIRSDDRIIGVYPPIRNFNFIGDENDPDEPDNENRYYTVITVGGELIL